MMTDNELKKWNKDAEDRIIKALECCADEGNIDACDDCPCQKGKCISTTPYVLDLINRQKAEIERLQSENKLLVENNISTKYPCHVLTSLGVISTKTLDDYDNLIGDISAEAVKEFAERLQNRCAKQDGCLWQSDIGAELNEFLGDKKNE